MPVGQRLADERRAQGMSLADVCAATRIMASKLEALEHDRYDELPAPAYVRGYIAAYARALGLDPAPFLAEYEREAGSADSGVRLSAMPELESVVPLAHQAHAVPRSVWIIALALIVVVALAAWMIRSLFAPSEDVPPVPPAASPQSSVTATSPGPGAAPVPAEPASAVPSASVDAAGETSGEFAVTVHVQPGTASWLRVTIDGRVAYEGTLTGGSRKEWTAERQAVVRAGKPSVVTLTRNGAPVSFASVGGIGVATITASP